MEPQNITMLSNLNALSNNYTFKLKIISLWRKMMHGRETETCRVDMICMDEEGHMILASCIHRILPRFKHHLKVDESFLISRSSLAPNNVSINYTKNKQKLTLNFYTQIKKSIDWNGPNYCFSFVNFKDVVQNRVELGTTVGL
ncbi:putative nucleic acid-binding protein [Helianthus annuus]|nr:putative nucleic acid-binding protein [Helianthus annuus]